MRMPVQHLLLLIYAGLPWGTPCRTGDDAHDAIVVPEKRTMACGGQSASPILSPGPSADVPANLLPLACFRRPRSQAFDLIHLTALSDVMVLVELTSIDSHAGHSTVAGSFAY